MPEFGPSAREFRAYGEIVDAGPLDARGLAMRLGIDPEEAEELLGGLRRKGLIYPDGIGGVIAAPPNVALRDVLEKAQALSSRWLADVGDLERRYRRRGGNDDVAQTIEVVVGLDAVIARAAQLMIGAERTIQTIADTIDIEIVPDDGYPALHSALARGVVNRVVLAEESLSSPSSLAQAIGRLPSAIQFRAVDRVPVRTMIVDERVMTLSIPPGSDGQARLMVLQNSPIVVAVTALFEYMWRVARPFRRDAGGQIIIDSGLDPFDASLLSMLLAGATDGTVAVELDSSVRTVQRRIHDLMAKFGVTSRMQLGYEVGRRGLPAV